MCSIQSQITFDCWWKPESTSLPLIETPAAVHVHTQHLFEWQYKRQLCCVIHPDMAHLHSLSFRHCGGRCTLYAAPYCPWSYWLLLAVLYVTLIPEDLRNQHTTQTQDTCGSRDVHAYFTASIFLVLSCFAIEYLPYPHLVGEIQPKCLVWHQIDNKW